MVPTALPSRFLGELLRSCFAAQAAKVADLQEEVKQMDLKTYQERKHMAAFLGDESFLGYGLEEGNYSDHLKQLCRRDENKQKKTSGEFKLLKDNIQRSKQARQVAAKSLSLLETDHHRVDLDFDLPGIFRLTFGTLTATSLATMFSSLLAGVGYDQEFDCFLVLEGSTLRHVEEEDAQEDEQEDESIDSLRRALLYMGYSIVVKAEIFVKKAEHNFELLCSGQSLAVVPSGQFLKAAAFLDGVVKVTISSAQDHPDYYPDLCVPPECLHAIVNGSSLPSLDIGHFDLSPATQEALHRTTPLQATQEFATPTKSSPGPGLLLSFQNCRFGDNGSALFTSPNPRLRFEADMPRDFQALATAITTGKLTEVEIEGVFFGVGDKRQIRELLDVPNGRAVVKLYKNNWSDPGMPIDQLIKFLGLEPGSKAFSETPGKSEAPAAPSPDGNPLWEAAGINKEGPIQMIQRRRCGACTAIADEGDCPACNCRQCTNCGSWFAPMHHPQCPNRQCNPSAASTDVEVESSGTGDKDAKESAPPSAFTLSGEISDSGFSFPVDSIVSGDEIEGVSGAKQQDKTEGVFGAKQHGETEGVFGAKQQDETELYPDPDIDHFDAFDTTTSAAQSGAHVYSSFIDNSIPDDLPELEDVSQLHRPQVSDELYPDPDIDHFVAFDTTATSAAQAGARMQDDLTLDVSEENTAQAEARMQDGLGRDDDDAGDEQQPRLIHESGGVHVFEIADSDADGEGHLLYSNRRPDGTVANEFAATPISAANGRRYCISCLNACTNGRRAACRAGHEFENW